MVKKDDVYRFSPIGDFEIEMYVNPENITAHLLAQTGGSSSRLYYADDVQQVVLRYDGSTAIFFDYYPFTMGETTKLNIIRVGSTYTLYENDTPVVTQTEGTTKTFEFNQLAGKIDSTGVPRFAGRISNVAVWNDSARTNQELLMPINDNDTTIIDYSTNANNGTLVAGTGSWVEVCGVSEWFDVNAWLDSSGWVD